MSARKFKISLINRKSKIREIRVTRKFPNLQYLMFSDLFSVLNNKEECATEVHSPAAILGALRERRWVIFPEEQVPTEPSREKIDNLSDQVLHKPSCTVTRAG